jgi:Protein of unknown function (DUF2442)
MTTKTLNNPRVEFFATSRLAHAYRSAARQNRRLAQWAAMHELGHFGSLSDVIGRVHNAEMVVLSHADDDHLMLTGPEMKPVVSGAFHMLFTEPATHPEQVAQWMRTTKIRSENRLHVIKVEDLEGPQVSNLLGRVCYALGRDGSRGSIIDAYLAGDSLLVRGPKHRMLHVPTNKLSSLRGQPQDVLRNFRIDPDGSFIHWPDLDVHLGWNQFLQAVEPAELRKAQQRSADFNCRYGAAIRKLREQADIPQAKVEGITERQLRRIEQGECRATMNALRDLAKAHGLDVNAYMEKVANAMS